MPLNLSNAEARGRTYAAARMMVGSIKADSPQQQASQQVRSRTSSEGETLVLRRSERSARRSSVKAF